MWCTQNIDPVYKWISLFLMRMEEVTGGEKWFKKQAFSIFQKRSTKWKWGAHLQSDRKSKIDRYRDGEHIILEQTLSHSTHSIPRKLMSWWTSFSFIVVDVVVVVVDDIFLPWIKISFNVRLFAKWWLVFFAAAAAICFCLFQVVGLCFSYCYSTGFVVFCFAFSLLIHSFAFCTQFSDCGRLASPVEATHIPLEMHCEHFDFIQRKWIDAHSCDIHICQGIRLLLYLCSIWKCPFDCTMVFVSWLEWEPLTSVHAGTGGQVVLHTHKCIK